MIVEQSSKCCATANREKSFLLSEHFQQCKDLSEFYSDKVFWNRLIYSHTHTLTHIVLACGWRKKLLNALRQSYAFVAPICVPHADVLGYLHACILVLEIYVFWLSNETEYSREIFKFVFLLEHPQRFWFDREFAVFYSGNLNWA